MLKVDRTELDKAIENLVMFTDTEELVAEYEKEKNLLDNRGKAIEEQLQQLQEQHAKLLADRELCTDNPSDYIYLSKELTKTDEEVKLLLPLQERLQEDYKELKLKYAPQISRVYMRDLAAKNELNVGQLVESVRYELLKAVTDYAKAVKKQQTAVTLLAEEFIDDKDVKEEYPRLAHRFDYDAGNLSFSHFEKYVIHKDDVFAACSGNLKYPAPTEQEAK
jgi:hypothetical protein